MDTITTMQIVIQLTGLLMIVPPPRAGGPTHVLMPAPVNVPHVAILGFRNNHTAQHCEPGFGEAFCFVRMEGWALEQLPVNAVVADPRLVTPPILDLTFGSGGRVHPDHVTDRAGWGLLRSRFTLGGGGVSSTCEMGEWSFDPVGSPPARRMPLSNVVDWTIRNVPRQSITLWRRPLRGNPGSREPLVTLSPEQDRIELLIAHVPTDMWETFRQNLLRVTLGPGRDQAAGAMASEARSVQPDALDTSILHFRSYYRLLRNIRGEPLPSGSDTLRPQGCLMTIWRTTLQQMLAPTTVSCMVTAATL